MALTQLILRQRSAGSPSAPPVSPQPLLLRPPALSAAFAAKTHMMCRSERETGRERMCVCVQCTRVTCCDLRPCDPNSSAKTLLVYGVKQRQKGSKVEEGEPERLTNRSSGPKQRALPGLKKGVDGGGGVFIYSHRQTDRHHLSSGSELIGNTADWMSATWR